MKTFHVIAIPTDADATYEGALIGSAQTEDEAIALCKSEGYVVLTEGEGGNIDCYDAEDAPRVYGYEADGLGAFGVTVQA